MLNIETNIGDFRTLVDLQSEMRHRNEVVIEVKEFSYTFTCKSRLGHKGVPLDYTDVVKLMDMLRDLFEDQ